MRVLVFQHADAAHPGRFGELWRRRGYVCDVVRLNAGQPIPDLADAMRQRAAGDPNWEVVKAGVGDKPGTLQLNIMESSPLSSFLAPSDVVAWLAHTADDGLEECVRHIATMEHKDDQPDVFAALLRHADGPELARVLFEHRDTNGLAVPARARHQQILAMAGRILPFLQHLGKGQESRADIFGRARFAQRRDARGEAPRGAVADRARRRHRLCLLERDRIELAVEFDRRQMMRAAIGADRVGIVVGLRRSGATLTA